MVRNDWLKRPGSGHVVQLYQADDELLANLAAYVSDGLRKGESCIVIATAEHRAQLEMRLCSHTDFWQARRRGLYRSLDAVETLATFMDGGRPDRRRFMESVGTLIRQCAAGGRPIRAYGEMVALLWAAGESAGALDLESLWNELGENERFALFCAYPSSYFSGRLQAQSQVELSHDRILLTHAA